MVPATSRTPRFHEGFRGYGKNKIEWVHHLRFAGFSFHVLSRKAFVIHVAHPKSSSNAAWKTNVGRIKSRNNDLYWAWMRHLRSVYASLEGAELAAVEAERMHGEERGNVGAAWPLKHPASRTHVQLQLCNSTKFFVKLDRAKPHDFGPVSGEAKVGGEEEEASVEGNDFALALQAELAAASEVEEVV
jgi:hypothetical protein